MNYDEVYDNVALEVNGAIATATNTADNSIN